MAERALVVDLGGTRTRSAVIARSGEVIFAAETATPAAAGPEAVVATIARLVDEARASGGAGLAPVCLCAPGPLDTVAGRALGIQTLPGFAGFALRAALEAALGTAVLLEHDGVAGAIGEWRFGAGRGLADLLYLTLSTGIGGGIIAGGRPLRGHRGLAGHVGHSLFPGQGPRVPGGVMPCLEDYASATALAFRAGEAARADPASSLHGGLVSAPAVFAAARAGDALAGRLVAEEAEILGLGITSLLHVLNPGAVILGGGMSAEFAVLGPAIRAVIDTHAKPGFGDVALLPAGLGSRSGLYGCAALIFDETGGAR
jgi:glucokinase